MANEEEDDDGLGAGKYPCMPSLVALQQMRNRLHLAFLGKKLMKWTAMATGRELRKIASELNESYVDFAAECAEAYILLARCRYFFPNLNKMVLEDIQKQANITVETNLKVVSAGVKSIMFEIEELEHEPYLHLGISKGGQVIKETKICWANLLKKMILILQLRNSYIAVDAANKSATKKQNVLGKVVVPKLKSAIKYITSELEELAREDNFRLKTFKKSKMKKAGGDVTVCTCCLRVYKKDPSLLSEKCKNCIKARSAKVPVIVKQPVVCGHISDENKEFIKENLDKFKEWAALEMTSQNLMQSCCVKLQPKPPTKPPVVILPSKPVTPVPPEPVTPLPPEPVIPPLELKPSPPPVLAIIPPAPKPKKPPTPVSKVKVCDCTIDSCKKTLITAQEVCVCKPSQPSLKKPVSTRPSPRSLVAPGPDAQEPVCTHALKVPPYASKAVPISEGGGAKQTSEYGTLNIIKKTITITKTINEDGSETIQKEIVIRYNRSKGITLSSMSQEVDRIYKDEIGTRSYLTHPPQEDAAKCCDLMTQTSKISRETKSSLSTSGTSTGTGLKMDFKSETLRHARENMSKSDSKSIKSNLDKQNDDRNNLKNPKSPKNNFIQMCLVPYLNVTTISKHNLKSMSETTYAESLKSGLEKVPLGRKINHIMIDDSQQPESCSLALNTTRTQNAMLTKVSLQTKSEEVMPCLASLENKLVDISSIFNSQLSNTNIVRMKMQDNYGSKPLKVETVAKEQGTGKDSCTKYAQKLMSESKDTFKELLNSETLSNLMRSYFSSDGISRSSCQVNQKDMEVNNCIEKTIQINITKNIDGSEDIQKRIITRYENLQAAVNSGSKEIDRNKENSTSLYLVDRSGSRSCASYKFSEDVTTISSCGILLEEKSLDGLLGQKSYKDAEISCESLNKPICKQLRETKSDIVTAISQMYDTRVCWCLSDYQINSTKPDLTFQNSSSCFMFKMPFKSEIFGKVKVKKCTSMNHQSTQTDNQKATAIQCKLVKFVQKQTEDVTRDPEIKRFKNLQANIPEQSTTIRPSERAQEVKEVNNTIITKVCKDNRQKDTILNKSVQRKTKSENIVSTSGDKTTEKIGNTRDSKQSISYNDIKSRFFICKECLMELSGYIAPRIGIQNIISPKCKFCQKKMKTQPALLESNKDYDYDSKMSRFHSRLSLSINGSYITFDRRASYLSIMGRKSSCVVINENYAKNEEHVVKTTVKHVPKGLDVEKRKSSKYCTVERKGERETKSVTATQPVLLLDSLLCDLYKETRCENMPSVSTLVQSTSWSILSCNDTSDALSITRNRSEHFNSHEKSNLCNQMHLISQNSRFLEYNESSISKRILSYELRDVVEDNNASVTYPLPQDLDTEKSSKEKSEEGSLTTLVDKIEQGLQKDSLLNEIYKIMFIDNKTSENSLVSADNESGTSN